MKRVLLASAAILMGAGLASAQTTTPDLEGLVNVNIQDVLQDIAVDLNIEETNIPVTIQLPISVAANVCDVSVNVLSAQVDSGEATCAAVTGSQELTQIVQQEMAAGGSTGDATDDTAGTDTGDATDDTAGTDTGDATDDTAGTDTGDTTDDTAGTDTGDTTDDTADTGDQGTDDTTTGSTENDNSARQYAPGQQDIPANEAAPGQQEGDAKDSAPGQMKKQTD